MDKIFAKTLKTSFFGLFELSKPILIFVQKPGLPLFLLFNVYLHGEKSRVVVLLVFT